MEKEYKHKKGDGICPKCGGEADVKSYEHLWDPINGELYNFFTCSKCGLKCVSTYTAKYKHTTKAVALNND